MHPKDGRAYLKSNTGQFDVPSVLKIDHKTKVTYLKEQEKERVMGC
jgi:hypothetical protein